MPALKPKPQATQPPQSCAIDVTPAEKAAMAVLAARARRVREEWDKEWDKVVIKDEDQCDPDDIDSWWTWPEDKMYPGNDVATLIKEPGEKAPTGKWPADIIAKVELARRMRAEKGEVVIKDEDQCDPDNIDSWWTWPEETLNTTRDDHVATLIKEPIENLKSPQK